MENEDEEIVGNLSGRKEYSQRIGREKLSFWRKLRTLGLGYPHELYVKLRLTWWGSAGVYVDLVRKNGWNEERIGELDIDELEKIVEMYKKFKKESDDIEKKL